MVKENLVSSVGMVMLVCLVIFLTQFSVAATPVSLSDQGTGVTNKTDSSLLSLGDLVVSVYDNLTLGNLIYTENFSSAILNGSWDLMLGENSSNQLMLEFGRIYYKDYTINGEDVDFINFEDNTVERKYFYSPLGDIGDEDLNLTNLTLVNLNITGVTHFGNVTVDTDNITVQNIIPKDSNSVIFWGNTSAFTGFFTFIGSLTSRITGLFIADIDFSSSINSTTGTLNLSAGTGNIDSSGNISADKVKVASGTYQISRENGEVFIDYA
ncbi:MAG: hypothetical protein ACI83O_000378 [Patescibacteria group bacterium]|jgi:hypothetical protein